MTHTAHFCGTEVVCTQGREGQSQQPRGEAWGGASVCAHSVVEVETGLQARRATGRGEKRATQSGATHAAALPTPARGAARGAGHLQGRCAKVRVAKVRAALRTLDQELPSTFPHCPPPPSPPPPPLPHPLPLPPLASVRWSESCSAWAHLEKDCRSSSQALGAPAAAASASGGGRAAQLGRPLTRRGRACGGGGEGEGSLWVGGGEGRGGRAGEASGRQRGGRAAEGARASRLPRGALCCWLFLRVQSKLWSYAYLGGLG